MCVRLWELLETAIAEGERGTLDEKFRAASKHVLRARKRMIEKDLPLGASSNEGFFTGAMCDAMNSFLEGRFPVCTRLVSESALPTRTYQRRERRGRG